MTYMKPEMDVEKFDIIEEITADEESAINTASVNGKADKNSAVVVDEAIGTNLIIG